VDIHEGCGRAKFFWALAVADSKLLKAMVEFRVGNLKSSKVTDSSDGVLAANEGSKIFFHSEGCRFCGSEEASDLLGLGYICRSEECQKFAGQACTKVLECNHLCYGILGESVCLPCLHGCSGMRAR